MTNKAGVAAPSATKIFDVGIHEKLTLSQYAILAFQNIFGMTGMFVFPGLLGRAFQLPVEQIAYLYGMTFLVSGLVTVFQGIGLLRLPIVQGPYVGSFIGLLVLGHTPGLGLDVAFGSFFVASLIWALLAVPIHGLSFLALFGRLFQAPLIGGVMVLLLTMQIAGVSLPNWIGQPSSPGFAKINFFAGLVAAVVFILLTLWGGKWFRRCAILAGLIVGTACYSGFLPISFAPVLTAPWIVVPRVFPFGFAMRFDAVLIFVFVLVPSSIASMALYQVVANWGNEKITSLRMSEGCFAAAVGAIIAAAVGAFSTTVYPDNMGMLRSTRVGSRYGTAAAGILLVVLGSCVKFDMLLVMVPIVVLAGVATVLFGIVMVHGIHLLAVTKWHDRNLIIAGAALMVGLGGLFVEPEAAKALPLTIQLVLKQSAVTGGFTLLLLYWLLGDRTKQQANQEVRDAGSNAPIPAHDNAGEV
jgi:xanthine/uracil permease